ncbi:MAG: RNA methyltransferase [Blastocatellia bacterium]|jgi:TrmH family RNA methyltransferase
MTGPGYDCRIVLVHPRDPNNIGAVARAMKNFGFSDLTVVAPHPPVWEEVTAAVRAGDVLAAARVVPTLAEAIEDRTFVVGTLDRTRVEARQSLFTPLDLSRDPQLSTARLALVFGSEKHGLVNDDLSHCHQLMSIPTNPDCPSINLGQSVAICCYELVREPAWREIVPRPTEAATAGAVDRALLLALETLRKVDFILPGNEPDLTRRLRTAFMKFRMSRYDVEMLCGILSRINRLK